MISHLSYLIFSIEQKIIFLCVCLLPNAILEKTPQKDILFFIFFCESVARNYLDMSFKELNIKLFFGPYNLDSFFKRRDVY